MRSTNENANAAWMFGTSLRELREAKRITLREFAKQVGIAASYVSNVESGAMVYPPTVSTDLDGLTCKIWLPSLAHGA